VRFHFWYVLIHVGLGLVGFEFFLFSNTGGVLAFGSALIVQSYAVFEIHRAAWQRFKIVQDTENSLQRRNKMFANYKNRLLRVWFMRSCLYALLTLISAMAVRGDGLG